MKLKKYAKVISGDLYLIVYCPDKYIIQRMCDETVDFLAALKLIPNWFVTCKMIIKRLHCFVWR